MLKSDKIKSLDIVKNELLREYGFFYLKSLQGEETYYETSFKEDVDIPKKLKHLENRIDLINRELNNLKLKQACSKLKKVKTVKRTKIEK